MVGSSLGPQGTQIPPHQLDVFLLKESTEFAASLQKFAIVTTATETLPSATSEPFSSVFVFLQCGSVYYLQYRSHVPFTSKRSSVH